MPLFRNDSSEQIPPFAVLRLTGLVVLEQARVVLTADKPNTFGSQYLCAVNGPTPVAAGKLGVCTREPGVAALYDSADGVPAFGERWGPRAGSWKLRKNTGGFVVHGVTNSAARLALVAPDPFVRFRGLTDAAIDKAASGTVSIYAWNGTTFADTGENMPGVLNQFADIGAGKIVECTWQGDPAGQTWILVAAEC